MAALSRADHLRPGAEVAMRPNLFAPLTRMCVMVGLAAIVIAPPFAARSAQPKPMHISGTNLLIADARSPTVANPRSGAILPAESAGCRSTRKRFWVEREGWLV